MAIKLKPLTAGWLVLIIYTVGFVGFNITETKSLMKSLIWVNLVITLVFLLLFHKKWNKEFIIASIVVGVCGYLLEVLGVKTGVIFGHYQYGANLGFKYWDTPLMMFVNWLLTVYLTRQIAEQVTKDPMLHCLTGAALMVVLDFFIEPFAVRNDMWSWQNGIIPIQNYIAWFIAGFVFHYLYLKSVKFTINKLSLSIYLIQLAFFIGLYLLNK